jgi:1,4-alpha-glucan branching enzyme
MAEPAPASSSDTWEQATADDVVEPAQAGTVDVVFTFPADVEATSVALSGEFNDWSEDDILLSRDTDGTWRTTVALMPGRYRYRFLIDRNRWENARQADDYVPNPYGELDSVVIVGPPES